MQWGGAGTGGNSHPCGQTGFRVPVLSHSFLRTSFYSTIHQVALVQCCDKSLWRGW